MAVGIQKDGNGRKINEFISLQPYAKCHLDDPTDPVTKENCRVRIIDPSDFTLRKIDELERAGIRGLVVGHVGDPIARRLLSSPIPVVLVVRTLTRLLARRHDRPITVLCSQKTSVLRESTASTVPATTLIRRALEFVKTHAAEDIRVDDVVAHLGVSRALVELRFRQFHEKSLARAILEARLQEVRRRLLRSSATCVSIARSCGWDNPGVLRNAFRRHYGISMRDMRKRGSS